jgi:hypothetical protein
MSEGQTVFETVTHIDLGKGYWRLDCIVVVWQIVLIWQLLEYRSYFSVGSTA